MDFALSLEQQQLQKDTRSFAERELGCNLVQRDANGAVSERYWREDWRKCAEIGILALCVPKQYGGQGLDPVTTIIALEALGYGCPDNGLTLALNGQIWAVQAPILEFGSDAQKERYLPGLCDGSLLGAHGATERESGSNIAGLKSTAERKGDGFVLNGVKTYVGLAPACDMAIIFASTDPSKGPWGVSAFLVDAQTPGFERPPPQQKMGLRTVPMGEIVLNDCWVPASAQLGRAGAGSAIFQHAMEWERSFIFASHVGSMNRQLDECVNYANERMVFGQPIDNFQSVSNRLADMRLRLDSAQLLLYRAAWLKAQGKPSALEAALAKLHLSEAFVASSLDAIRIHGGRGYLSETGVERDLRDAVGGVIYSGTSDIQRQVIAKLLKS
ncbi:MAG: acyl-CoA dehydrogenase family protein [Rhodobacteraceae bacterium]|nr:acyl-CoA dehydrogenase family protein [Paracoccaceae bacterium]